MQDTLRAVSGGAPAVRKSRARRALAVRPPSRMAGFENSSLWPSRNSRAELWSSMIATIVSAVGMGAQYDCSFPACGRIRRHRGVRADLAGAAIVLRVIVVVIDCLTHPAGRVIRESPRVAFR